MAVGTLDSIIESQIVLVPSRRERWIRLIWPWGVVSVMAAVFLVGSGRWWLLPLAMIVLGWGVYEFRARCEVVFGPWALEVTHLGRTRKVPWRKVTAALPGAVTNGQFVRIGHKDTDVRGFLPLLILHYGYGYSADGLAMLINDRRAAAVPDEPHPFTREKLRRLDRIFLVAIPLVVVGVAILMMVFGMLP